MFLFQNVVVDLDVSTDLLYCEIGQHLASLSHKVQEGGYGASFGEYLGISLEGHPSYFIPVLCKVVDDCVGIRCPPDLYEYCRGLCSLGYAPGEREAPFSIPAWISMPFSNDYLAHIFADENLKSINGCIIKNACFVRDTYIQNTFLALPRRRLESFNILLLVLEHLRQLCLSFWLTDLVSHFGLSDAECGKAPCQLYSAIFEKVLGREKLLRFCSLFYESSSTLDYQFNLWGREDTLCLTFLQQSFLDLKVLATRAHLFDPGRHRTLEDLVEALTLSARTFEYAVSRHSIDSIHLLSLYLSESSVPEILSLPSAKRIFQGLKRRYGVIYALSAQDRIVICTDLHLLRSFAAVDTEPWKDTLNRLEATWPQVPDRKVVHDCIRRYRRHLVIPPIYTCCVCSRQRFGLRMIGVAPCPLLFASFGALHPREPTVIRYMTSKHAASTSFRIRHRGLLDSRGFHPLGGDDHEQCYYVLCEDCHSSLYNNSLPKYALANDLFVGILPLEFYDATYAEEQACALFRNHICVQRLYQTEDDTTSRVLYGNSCAFPQNVVSTANVLPNSPQSVLSNITIVFVGSRKITKDDLRYYRQYNVRRDVIWAMLMFFRQFHILYQNLPPFSKEFLELYPLNDLLPGIEDHVIHDLETSPQATFLEETASFQTHPAVEFIHSLGAEASGTVYMERTGVLDPQFLDIPSRVLDISAMTNLVRPTMSIPLPDIVIFRGEKPVNEYQNSDLFPGMFPTLFPLGLGGFEVPHRRESLSFRTQAEYFLDVSGKAFRAHYSFLFAAVNIYQRREGHNSTRFAVSRSSFPKIAPQLLAVRPETLSNLAVRFQSNDTTQPLSSDEREAMSLFRQLNTIAAKVPGSDASRLHMRKQIRAYIQFFGVAHLFITINPSAVHSPVFHFAWGDRSVDLELKHPLTASSAERCQRIATDPVVAADFYEFSIHAVLDILFGWDFKTKRSRREGGIIGHIKAYFISNELTNRANFHGHGLFWVVGGINPGEMHEKMSDPAFKQRFFDYYEMAIHNHYPDVDVVVPDDYKCTQALPTMPPPFESIVDPESEGAKDWDALFKAEVKECVIACQFHKCANVCFKYGSKTCRFNFPLEVVKESFYDPETQSVYARLLDGWVNYFNPILMYCLRHNHDIKCILSGKACRSAMLYITDYISKMELTTYEALSLLSKAVASNSTDEELPPVKAARSLLHHCLAQFTRRQQLHAQYAARLIRGKGDAMYSHETKYMLSYGILMSAKERLLLSDTASSEPPVSYDDVVPIKMNSDGDLTISTQVDDYLYRGPQLREMNFFDFVRLVDCVKNDRNTESSKKKKSKINYVSLLPAHCRSTTHHLVVRVDSETPFTGDVVVPQMLGCFPPRRDSDSFALFALAHFKPWSDSSPLVTFGETVENTFATYPFNAVAVTVMKNWEQYHDCTDQRDIDRLHRREKLREEAMSHVSRVLNAYPGDVEADEIANNQHRKIAKQDSKTILLLSLLQLSGWVDVNADSMQDENKLNVSSASEESQATLNITVSDAKEYTGVLTKLDKDIRQLRINGRTAETEPTQSFISSNIISSTLSSDLQGSGTKNVASLPSNPVVLDSLARNSDEAAWLTSVQDRISQTKGLNEKQDLAFRTICRGYSESLHDKSQVSMHMLMDGPGGTGKTYVISAVSEMLSALNAHNVIMMLAPTGNAASLIKGSTIHRSLNIQYKRVDLENETFVIGSLALKKRRELQAEYEHVQIVFIDEVSMVSQELLADINASLQLAKQSKNWMGGVLIVYCGDLLQYPPVLAAPLYKPIRSKDRVTSNRHIRRRIGRIVWKRVSAVITLTEQKRMQTDAEFGSAVSRLRMRQCTQQDVELFNSRVIKSVLNPDGVDITSKEWDDACMIVDSNESRETLNLHKCRTVANALGQKLVMSAAVDRIQKSELCKTDRVQLLMLERPSDATAWNFMPGFVPCFIGMPVVLRYTNLYTELGITNGARGTIRYLHVVSDKYGFDIVDFAIVEFKETCVHLQGLPPRHVPILPRACSMSTGFLGKDTIHTFVRHQLPITPAYVITGHTAQGRTMEHVITSLTSTSPQAGFAAYVAISRCQTRFGLALLQPVTLANLNRPLPPELTQELHRLRILEHNTRLKFGLTSPLGPAILPVPDPEGEADLRAEISLDDLTTQHTVNTTNKANKVSKRSRALAVNETYNSETTHEVSYTKSKKRNLTSEDADRPSKKRKTRQGQCLDQPIPIAGPLWDAYNWSCAYDAFVVVFLGLAQLIPSFLQEQRTVLSMVFGSAFVQDIATAASGLPSITTRAITITRNVLRDHLSAANEERFPRHGRVEIAISHLFELLSQFSLSIVLPHAPLVSTDLEMRLNNQISLSRRSTILTSPPPFLIIESQVHGPMYGPTDRIPEHMHIGSLAYRLAGVVYHGLNHFTASVFLSAAWRYFDGALNGGRSSSLPGSPSATAGECRLVHLLVYVSSTCSPTDI